MKTAFHITLGLVALLILWMMWLQNMRLEEIRDGIKLERIAMVEVTDLAIKALEQAALDIEVYFTPEPDEYFDIYDITDFPTTTQPIELEATTTERICIEVDYIFDEEICTKYENNIR